MSRTESIEALRRANPRAKAGFAESVEAAAHAVRAQIASASEPPTFVPRRRLMGLSVVGSLVAAVAAIVTFLTIGPTGGGSGVEDATAAVRKAATSLEPPLSARALPSFELRMAASSGAEARSGGTAPT